MSKLIEALQIFVKYGDPEHPTACAHDTLVICGIDPGAVSAEDLAKLLDLGFFVSEEYEGFASFKFGSA